MAVNAYEKKLETALVKEITRYFEIDPEVGLCIRYEESFLTSAFQPILRYKDGEVADYGYEALIRAVDDDVKFSPFHFIMSLDTEKRRLFDRVSRAMHIRNFILLRNCNAKIFLNTDPINYNDSKYQENAISIMLARANDAGLSLRNVIIELMESEAGNEDVLKKCITELRKNGAGVAIDDYGIEHSDLNRVKTMRPDLVKFDRSWLTRGRESEANRQDFYAHVKELRGRQIKILVEGVEFEEDLGMVEHINPDLVQGYWYGKPKKINTYISNILPLPVDYDKASLQ